MEDRFITTEQAADYLSVAPSSLVKLRHYGGGPKFYKLGARVRYKRSDLDAWATAGACTSTTDDARAA